MKPATKKVMLKKGAKFSAIVGTTGGKVKRKRFVGPCEVSMTEEQVEAFKDTLQTAPQVVIAKEPEAPKEEGKGNGKPNGNPAPEGGKPGEGGDKKSGQPAAK